MLDKISFRDKDKKSLSNDQRILTDTNINQIKTKINAVVDYLNTNHMPDNMQDAIEALSSYYTKNEIENLLDNLINQNEITDFLTGYYNRNEISQLLSKNYTKAEIDNLFQLSNSEMEIILNNYYTKNEINNNPLLT